jgi:hypothetical protein
MSGRRMVTVAEFRLGGMTRSELRAEVERLGLRRVRREETTRELRRRIAKHLRHRQAA